METLEEIDGPVTALTVRLESESTQEYPRPGDLGPCSKLEPIVEASSKLELDASDTIVAPRLALDERITSGLLPGAEATLEVANKLAVSKDIPAPSLT